MVRGRGVENANTRQHFCLFCPAASQDELAQFCTVGRLFAREVERDKRLKDMTQRKAVRFAFSRWLRTIPGSMF